MLQASTVEERILYWLSLDTQVRALAERLLEWGAVAVGDLPASAAHWTGTSPVCKFLQGENFFIPARSFLPTRWALGCLRAEFAPLRQAPGGQPTTTGRNFWGEALDFVESLWARDLQPAITKISLASCKLLPT
jgi:hypothetical protein